MPKQSIFFKFLREPLFHFLLIGIAIFFLFSQFSSNTDEINEKDITITQEKFDSMSASFLRARGREATLDEMQGFVENEIREELLYKEAIALGLDKDDGIIRRRLAQKMKYLFEDLAVITEPNDTELNAYLKKNTSKFSLPSTCSFFQVYIDPKLHKGNLDTQLKSLVKELENTSADKAFTLGDRSYLKYHFKNRRKSDVVNSFGESFSNKLFQTPTNAWKGPFESAYGLHFVYINERSEAVLLKLEQVRKRLTQAYKMQKQAEANELFYKTLKNTYKIHIDDNLSKVLNMSANL